MVDSKASEAMYSWWVDLLISYGLNVENKDPFNTDARVALAHDEGIVCFKFSPRHYLFGVDSDNGNIYWYTFLPEVGEPEESLVSKKRKDFCNELERILNQEKDKEFDSFFTLPVKIAYSQKQFGDKTYHGVLVSVNSCGDLFAKRKLSSKALKSWRKNIFIPLCKFLETHSM